MLALSTSGTELAGLGGTWDDLAKIIDKVPEYIDDVAKIVDKAGKYLPTLAHIAEDPALPLIVERVKKLRALEKERKAKEAASGKVSAAEAAKPAGIGLRHFVAPLDAFITVREKPWIPYAVIGGSALLLIGVGVVVGRVSKRGKKERSR